jgi:hypothetical protein
VSGFHILTETIAGGNELVETTALYTADVFQNNGGSPGALVGGLAVQGSMDFTYFGRASASQLGTFDAQITDFDFTGTFNTHTFTFRQAPGQPSLGQTTITEVRDGLFQVSSFFAVFGEFSIDQGPFMPAPERDFTLAAVP